MNFIIYLLVGIITSGVDSLVFKIKDLKKIIFSLVGYTVLVNLVVLSFLSFILKTKDFYNSTKYLSSFGVKYFVLGIAVGFLFILIRLLAKDTLKFEKRNYKLNKKQIINIVITIILFALGAFLFIGTKWFIGYFGKLTPEQFIFNFNSPIKGTADNFYVTVFEKPVLALATIMVLFLIVLFSKYYVMWNGKKVFSDMLVKKALLGISILTVVGGSAYTVNQLQLVKVYQAYFSDSKYVQDNYVKPTTKNVKFPKKKRNLIHIYLESYENSFLDKKDGGYMNENLMPDLQKLSKEGVSFSQNDKFGGPYETYGSSWSVASMVNMSSGLPLKIPMNGNSYGKTGHFLPGTTTIGDILSKEGYEQTIMFGADADFGGLTAFFTEHGKFKIFDYKYAKENKLIPPKYKVWWGYEDKKLYKFAQDEITRLAKTNKPFNFTMENADTHFPDGYLDADAPTPHKQQYANVIAHSQKQVYDFVRWAQKQDFYKDTTIVLTGDHLSMDKKFFKDFDNDYHRTTFNLILNGDFDNKNIKTNNRTFAPFDMFPTILSGMGVDINGNKLGLGTDLSSNEKTILERDGLQKFEVELAANSKFYNQEFVSEKNKGANVFK
ncbi:MAG: LTA synthase family protein [Erysipelotrichales bacterium]